MLNGIDISQYQSGINLNGLTPKPDFVFIKATEGVGYTDPAFANLNNQMYASGVLRGYYHFARPDLGNTPEAEASWFVQIAKPEKGEILALDYETNYSGDTVSWCLSWLKKVEELTGNKPLMYINVSTESGYNWQPVVQNNNGLWLAYYDYQTAETLPSLVNWDIVAMKQYTSTGRIAGYMNNLDQDIFFGDIDTWNKYAVGYTQEELMQPGVLNDNQTENNNENESELNRLQLALQEATKEVEKQKETNRLQAEENITLKDKISTDAHKIYEADKLVIQYEADLNNAEIALESCTKSLKDKVKDAGVYSGVSVIVATILGNMIIQTGIAGSLPIEQLVAGLTILVNMILVPLLSKLSKQ